MESGMSIGRLAILAAAVLLCPALCAPQQAVDAGELIREGRFAAARAVLSKELKAHPGDAGLWNLLGVASVQDHDPKAAEGAFRKAVHLAPRLESAWLNLGRLYQLDPANAQYLDNGVAAYEAVLRLNAASAEAHHQLALLLFWKKDFRASLSHLDLVPEEDRMRRAAQALRCADEAAMGNERGAMEAAVRLARDPGLAEDDILEILPVLLAHQQDVALRLLAHLNQSGLATLRTLPQLAGLWEQKGEWKRAREMYERVAQASPGSAPALLDLARVAWKGKDYEATLGYLGHARDLEPSNAGIHFFFGVTCNELNSPVEAKKALARALELAPENPYYNYAMGAVMLQWAEKEQALPYLKKFVAARPAEARGRLALAGAYFAMLRYDEAKAELALPLTDPQTRSGAEFLSGRIASQQGDYDGAAGHFRRVLEAEPQSVEAHAELGAAFLESDDRAGAGRESEAALAVDPENYTANRTLMRIYKLERDPRLKEQTERLQKLIAQRDAQAPLLQRTIEVRPW